MSCYLIWCHNEMKVPLQNFASEGIRKFGHSEFVAAQANLKILRGTYVQVLLSVSAQHQILLIKNTAFNQTVRTAVSANTFLSTRTRLLWHSQWFAYPSVHLDPGAGNVRWVAMAAQNSPRKWTAEITQEMLQNFQPLSTATICLFQVGRHPCGTFLQTVIIHFGARSEPLALTHGATP